MINVGIEIIICSIRQSRTPYDIEPKSNAPVENAKCQATIALFRNRGALYSKRSATQQPCRPC